MRRALPTLAALLLALALRGWLLAVLDLRDMPGASGVRTVARAALGLSGTGWDTWSVVALEPLAGDPVRAAHLVSLLAGLALVGGAALGGFAFGGRHAAAAAALLAALWSPVVELTLQVGPDPLSTGLAWFAVGLTWAGFASGWWGVPGVAAGAFLALMAVGTKELALPALALQALAPLAARWHRSFLAHLAAAALGAWLGLQVFGWPQLAHAATPTLSWAAALDGVRQAAGLPHDLAQPQGRFDVVVGAALLGGILPGPRWARRALLAAGSLAVLGLAASSTGDLLRPRYLLAAAMGAVVVSGLGLGLLGHHAARRQARAVPVLLAGALVALELFTSLDAWTTQRSWMTGARPAPVPAMPEALVRPYRHAPVHLQRDLTIMGGVELWELVEQRPAVAMPPLRDQRENHLVASARVLGTRYAVLYREACCGEDDEGDACAAETIAALDAAGATLLLPTPVPKTERVDRQDQDWWQALRRAAARAGGVSPWGEWWELREPSGGGDGPLPCWSEPTLLPDRLNRARQPGAGPP